MQAYAEKLKTFADMVNRHDLTYDYSDDVVVWNAGLKSYNAIYEFAKTIDRVDAVAIWNAAVDRKLTPEGGKRFHWK